jgi:hypothetical protein
MVEADDFVAVAVEEGEYLALMAAAGDGAPFDALDVVEIDQTAVALMN